MERSRRAIGTPAVLAVVVVGVIAVSVTTPALYSSTPTNTLSAINVSSKALCNQPSYLARLVSQIEGTQAFAQQAHGLSYMLVYGSNDSAETGMSNGQPIWYPPKTELALYSYGMTPTVACPATLGPGGVVGVLWVRVPINPDSSYNLANMTVHFTSGAPHLNGTSI